MVRLRVPIKTLISSFGVVWELERMVRRSQTSESPAPAGVTTALNQSGHRSHERCPVFDLLMSTLAVGSRHDGGSGLPPNPPGEIGGQVVAFYDFRAAHPSSNETLSDRPIRVAEFLVWIVALPHAGFVFMAASRPSANDCGSGFHQTRHVSASLW